MPRSLTSSLLLAALWLPTTVQAEDAWTTREAEALRWPDAEQISLELEQGDRVTVVYRADGMVRVRKDDAFGWVPDEALTDQDPAPAASADDPWELPEMPAFDMPSLSDGPMITPRLDPAPAAPTPPAPEAPVE